MACTYGLGWTYLDVHLYALATCIKHVTNASVQMIVCSEMTFVCEAKLQQIHAPFLSIHVSTDTRFNKQTV